MPPDEQSIAYPATPDDLEQAVAAAVAKALDAERAKATRVPPTTVASAEEDARLAPAAGGWAPPGWAPMAASAYCGVALALVPVVLAAFPGPIGLALAAVLGGSAGGVSAYFGLKSAGPRKPL